MKSQAPDPTHTAVSTRPDQQALSESINQPATATPVAPDPQNAQQVINSKPVSQLKQNKEEFPKWCEYYGDSYQGLINSINKGKEINNQWREAIERGFDNQTISMENLKATMGIIEANDNLISELQNKAFKMREFLLAEDDALDALDLTRSDHNLIFSEEEKKQEITRVHQEKMDHLAEIRKVYMKGK